jgi:hypothetical protein
VLGLLTYVVDVPFSVEFCELLLEFYDVPIASQQIFQLFLKWVENTSDADFETFSRMIMERKDEVVDFLDASECPEHMLFSKYLPVLEAAAVGER